MQRITLDFTPLRQMRRLRELSQTDLATAAGCHRVALANIERNREMPSSVLLVSIARALGEPIHHLYRVVEQ